MISCQGFRCKRLKVKFCRAFNYSKLKVPSLQNIKKWTGRITEASEESVGVQIL